MSDRAGALTVAGFLACLAWSIYVFTVGQNWRFIVLVVATGLPWAILISIHRKIQSRQEFVFVVFLCGVVAFLMAVAVQSIRQLIR